MRWSFKGLIIFTLIFICTAAGTAGEDKAAISEEDKVFVLSEALVAIGKTRNPQAYDFLLSALKSNHYFVRAYAGWGLGMLGDKRAQATLLKMAVSDSNYLVRINASWALVEMEQLDAEKTLEGFLNEKEPWVRANAVEILGASDEKCYLKLLDLLAKETDPSVRIKIFEQLDAQRLSQAMPYLKKASEEEDANVRRAACSALGRSGDGRVISLLIEKLGDKDVTVRAAAKEALGELKEGSLNKFFWQDVSDSDPFLRSSSYAALADLKDINIVPTLLKETINPDNVTLVKLSAARALVELKPYLKEIVDVNMGLSKVNPVLSQVIGFDYVINGSTLISRIIGAADDPRDPLYQDAPLILEELKDVSGVAALRRSLFHDDPDAAARAAHALGELEDKSSFDDLVKLCKKYGL